MATHSGHRVISDGLAIAIETKNVKCYNSGTSTNLSSNATQPITSMTPSFYKNKLGGVTHNNGVYINSDGDTYFDGVDDFLFYDYFSTNYNTASTPWTVEMWIKFPDVTQTDWHGMWGNGLGIGGYWMWHSNGKMTWYETFDGASRIWYFSQITLGTHIAQNEWVHLAWTMDGLGEANQSTRMYLNGVLKATHSPGVLYTTGNYTATPKYIGSGAGRYGSHTMGEFRYYERLLTDEEVYQNYASSRGKYA